MKIIFGILICVLARLINIKKKYDDHLIYYSVITYDEIIDITETV